MFGFRGEDVTMTGPVSVSEGRRMKRRYGNQLIVKISHERGRERWIEEENER